MSKLNKIIRNRQFEIITSVGALAVLLSFIFKNEDIFNYGIAFSSIGLISIGMSNYLRKKDSQNSVTDLDSGRCCLALEREYWQALEVLAYEDGWYNWRDFFYMRVLPDKPEDISLASHVRLVVVKRLFVDYQFNGWNQCKCFFLFNRL